MTRKGRICLTVLVMLITGAIGGGSIARAQDESLNKAREAFDKAQRLFEAGSYAEAAAEFERAYEARNFPQFLFNIGAAYEKMGAYEKAASSYRRYLEADPDASDRVATEKRIAVLDKAAAEVAGKDPSTAQPPQAVAGLDEVAPRGLVVIESDPQGASIYVDDKKGKPLSKTPWNGSLEGEHLIILEREGYKPVERRISPDPNKLIIMYFGLAEEDYLGWIDITSNVPGADIYIDKKEAGAYHKAPYQGNLTPGKHKIWVTAEGYNEYYREVDIVAGETQKLEAVLEGSPVGYLNVRGTGVEKVSVVVDGKVACKRGPCKHPLHEGVHRVTIKRPGYKSYSTQIDVQARTEVTLRARLAPEPSRKDAVVAYVVSALFIGGGVWAGLQAKGLEDDLQSDIESGMPPPDEDDPRFTRGKIYSISADAAFAIGGVTLLTAIYYTFRDKGADSTGATDVRALGHGPRPSEAGHIAVQPQLSPDFAGLGMEVRW